MAEAKAIPGEAARRRRERQIKAQNQVRVSELLLSVEGRGGFFIYVFYDIFINVLEQQIFNCLFFYIK